MTDKTFRPFDIFCDKFGSELAEYKSHTWETHNVVGIDEDYEPIMAVPPVEITDEMIDQWIRQNEGTYNPSNGHFACTDCYIKIGQPSSPQGWVAP